MGSGAKRFEGRVKKTWRRLFEHVADFCNLAMSVEWQISASTRALQ